MAANLFVIIPAHHPGGSPKNYLAGAGHSVGWAITSGLLPLAAQVVSAFDPGDVGSAV